MAGHNAESKKVFKEVCAEVSEELIMKAGLLKLSEISKNIKGLQFNQNNNRFTGDLEQIVSLDNYIRTHLAPFPSKRSILRSVSLETTPGQYQPSPSSLQLSIPPSPQETSQIQLPPTGSPPLSPKENHFSDPTSPPASNHLSVSAGTSAVPNGLNETGSKNETSISSKDPKAASGLKKPEKQKEVSMQRHIWLYRCEVTDKPVTYEGIDIDTADLQNNKIVVKGPKELVKKMVEELKAFIDTVSKNVKFTPIDITAYKTKIPELKELIIRLNRSHENVTIWIEDSQIIVAERKSASAVDVVGTINNELKALMGPRRNRQMKVDRLEQTFRTIHGQKIHIFPGDITQLCTDVIICSTDRMLYHRGGLAKVVAAAAGKQLKSECDQFLGIHRELTEKKAALVGAGDLPSKMIAFVLIPYNVTDGNALFGSLTTAFAEIAQHQLKSVAIPAIGAGETGMDKDLVTDVIAEAVLQFCQRVTSISDFLLVDKNHDMPRRLGQCFIKKAQSHQLELLDSPEFNNFIKINVKQGSDDRAAAYQAEVPPWGQSQSQVSHGDAHGQATADYNPDHKSKTQNDENCSICMDTITNRTNLKCGHGFCKGCIDDWFKHKKQCPQCNQVFGIITGNQPPGTMEVSLLKSKLPGHEKDSSKTIQIDYNFPTGVQSADHPQPGKSYPACHRTAYLPDSTEGREVLRLLKIAFEAKVLFTIGRSVTTGKDGRVTWNDVHHKTKTYGGAEGFGYPDPTYLSRVRSELAAKGIK